MTNTVTSPMGGALDTMEARKAMIKSQLRTSGVNEEYVLARMQAVAREDFLPAEKKSLAYIDRTVRLEEGALAAPLFYGKLLVEAAPTKRDRALVVEGGTGYLAALLGPLVDRLDTISANDAANGVGDTSGEYSLIVIDGAIEHVPESLAALMAENGRLTAGLVERNVTRLASGRKISGRVALQPFEDLGIPVLHQFEKPRGWSFS